MLVVHDTHEGVALFGLFCCLNNQEDHIWRERENCWLFHWSKMQLLSWHMQPQKVAACMLPSLLHYWHVPILQMITVYQKSMQQTGKSRAKIKCWSLITYYNKANYLQIVYWKFCGIYVLCQN